MYLVDANVFLEALLEQEETLSVHSFLESTDVEQMFVTDLALHSIGIILFSLKKPELFMSFLENIIINKIKVLSLEVNELVDVRKGSQIFQLDFEDAYQYTIAEKYNLHIVTFDKHFNRTTRKGEKPSEVLKSK